MIKHVCEKMRPSWGGHALILVAEDAWWLEWEGETIEINHCPWCGLDLYTVWDKKETA